MALKDLNDTLHTRNVSDPRITPVTVFDADANEDDALAKQKFVPSVWQVSQETFISRNKKALLRGVIAFGILFFLGLSYVVFVKIQQSAFVSSKTTVSIDGPNSVSGTNDSLFVFTYVNANRSDLTDAQLLISYPDNFQPDAMQNMTINGTTSEVHIGPIAGHSHGRIEIRGKFHGSKGTLAYVKGVLRYKPVSVGSFFQSEAQLGVTIATPSIKLSLDAPREMASGNVAEYRVDYTNMSDVPFDRLRLKMEYPDGFHFQSAVPAPSEGDSVWYVGDMPPGKSGQVHILGTIDGERNQAKIAKVHIGLLQGNGDLLSYSDSNQLTRIIAAPLTITQKVNGLDKASIAFGDILQYDIAYRNDGETALRNTIISFQLNGSVLDLSRLTISDGGSFDTKNNTIVWNASGVRSLANLSPNESGTVSVSAPLVRNFVPQALTDKNFTVKSVVKIDSPDIATPTGVNKIIASNTLVVKVKSAVNITTSAAYQDVILSNTGPFPPVLGTETTYTLRLGVTNTVNDADKVSVSAYLPTGVRWTGKTSPADENISFNERTNQVVWNIGSLQSGTGTVNPAREVLFQVGVTPQPNQSLSVLSVLDDTTLTAHDLFTDETVLATAMPQIITSR
jgi:hypothetical protein